MNVKYKSNIFLLKHLLEAFCFLQGRFPGKPFEVRFPSLFCPCDFYPFRLRSVFHPFFVRLTSTPSASSRIFCMSYVSKAAAPLRTPLPDTTRYAGTSPSRPLFSAYPTCLAFRGLPHKRASAQKGDLPVSGHASSGDVFTDHFCSLIKIHKIILPPIPETIFANKPVYWYNKTRLKDRRTKA